MHYINEQNIFLFLLQFLLLLGLARGLGEVFRRWKQPAITAEILVGVLLGPTVLGRLLPAVQQWLFPTDAVQQNMLDTIGWLGVLFLLLETGLEVDFSSAWRQRGDALKIALTGVVVPLAIGFVGSVVLPSHYLADPNHRIIFALFLATAMAISAMPVAARVLHDLNLSKTDLGFLVMSAMSVNDIIGWLLVTLTLGFFTQTSPEVAKVFILFAATIGFAVLCLTVGRSLANLAIFEIKRRELPQPGTALTFIALLGVLCGAVTQWIGIHALFGFFLAGIMAGEAKGLSERTRQIVAQMVYALLVPIFFAGIGLKIDFVAHFDPLLVAFVTVLSIGGKYLGAWLGVRLTKLPPSNRHPIAIAHIPGGAMEIIIGLLALQYGLITQTVFVALVFGVVCSSVILGPWLTHAISRRKEVSILEYFSRRSLIPDLRADLRDPALRELAELAAAQEYAHEAEDIYAAVLGRENEMGTALEEGLAIPHARFARMVRPIIVFGRSRSGIEDWNSPDGRQTHFIFLVLAPPQSDDQVQILAHIVRTMQEPTIREALLEAEDADAIWAIFLRTFASRRVVRPRKKRRHSRRNPLHISFPWTRTWGL
jgi:Kef-type K+ transport system membrane component KefB/mannitol/fructose-specific phosphotransferase system IIA component (Ntr-type)